ncbi:MAG: DUF58 domain-containing protein [Acidimicrobiia bacterium]|nr:DUF58 domain-containing protein [Acidimicrobiia bacterium]
MLLEPQLRARLERLALTNRTRLRGVWGGRHRSTRLGESLDFADYREYNPGDDYRRIDYNLWARLGVVLIRLFEAEDEMPLQVVIDTSRSMDFGEKFSAAQRLAAMVSYLALISGERIRLATVPEPGSSAMVGPWARHVSAWPKLETWLEDLEADGGTDLVAASRIVASTVSRGPIVLISDLMQDGWQQAVDLFGTARGGVVLHVLSPAEIDPELTGDLTLRDIETKREVPVSMSGDAVDRYRQRMQSFMSDAARRCRRVGLDYVQATADADILDRALRQLVTGGLVR